MTRIDDGARCGEVGDHLRPGHDGLWRDWGGDGPVLHFAHANGFPPGTYRKLVAVLRGRFHVVSMGARPLWSNEAPGDLEDWSQLAGDLRLGLARRGLRGTVAVGHSLGAVISLLAAADDPGLFSAIVAIDPLVLTGGHSILWATMKRTGLGGRLGLVRGARGRRDRWPDRAAAEASYRKKAIFSDWDPDVLDDYVHAGLEEAQGEGFRLRYPKAWEARIFEVAPHNLWSRLRRLSVPMLFVQGEHSDTFLDAARRRVLRELPTARAEVVPGASHFVPMERPQDLGRVILEFLAGSDDAKHEGGGS